MTRMGISAGIFRSLVSDVTSCWMKVWMSWRVVFIFHGFDRIKAIFRPKNQLFANQSIIGHKGSNFIPLWEK